MITILSRFADIGPPPNYPNHRVSPPPEPETVYEVLGLTISENDLRRVLTGLVVAIALGAVAFFIIKRIRQSNK